MTQIISVVGKSNSGKTTLIEKLIPELKKRGYKIGTVKHAHHGFDIDKKGKDSRRHFDAGADTVMVTSPGKIAMVKKEDNRDLDSLEKYFSGMDIIITEGYKTAGKPKIEVFRTQAHHEPACLDDDNLIAFVTDSDLLPEVPLFGFEDIVEIADLIQKKFL